jgi:adenylate kinase
MRDLGRGDACEAGVAEAAPRAPSLVLERALILLGAPGAGKGTQAREIARIYSVPHLSTGDMFREHVAKGTDLGRRAKPIMDSGQLVPDEIVLGMVEERVARPDCTGGFVLDGFPRTLAQAERLEEILSRLPLRRALAVDLAVDPELVIRRIVTRRTCKNCGAIYSTVGKMPRVPGKCDVCGGNEIIQRPDDREEVVRQRLAAYEKQTRPLIDFYRGQGQLRELDGSRDIAIVQRDLLDLLGKLD